MPPVVISFKSLTLFELKKQKAMPLVNISCLLSVGVFTVVISMLLRDVELAAELSCFVLTKVAAISMSSLIFALHGNRLGEAVKVAGGSCTLEAIWLLELYFSRFADTVRCSIRNPNCTDL